MTMSCEKFRDFANDVQQVKYRALLLGACFNGGNFVRDVVSR